MARTFVTMAGAAALTGMLAALSAPAMAQYPDRPIKMIVPWAAGGDTDNIFRPFAVEFQKQIGQPVVIANIGGASGTVGAREAKTVGARRLHGLRGARLYPSDVLRRASATSNTATSSRSAWSRRRLRC